MTAGKAAEVTLKLPLSSQNQTLPITGTCGCKSTKAALTYANHALERERDILQAVMNGTKNHHLVYLDRDFNFVYVNEAYARICDHRPEEMIGKNHFALHPDAENEAIFVRVRDTGEPVEYHDKPYEFPGHPERGVTYWDWSLTPVRDSSDQVVGMVFSLFETTERKLAEDQLKNLTQRLSYHIDNSPLAVLELDANMQIIRWSDTAEHIFGWRTEEVLGKHLEDLNLVHEEDELQVSQILSKMLKTKKQSSFLANRNYSKNGSVIYCQWYNSVMLDDSGNPKSILCFGLDVTDRKNLENSLEQYSVMLESRVAKRTAELREKDRQLLQQSRMAAMGEMINNIAHQWRQPLNTLGMNIQSLLLFYDMGDFDRDFLETSCNDAMGLIQYMSETVDDFRNYFKPDKEKVDFDVNQAIQSIINLVDNSFKHNGVKVVFKSKGEALINGYRNEFCQSILNIVQNASDALTERESCGGFVNITSSIKNGKAIITIIDNGGGIPEEIIDKIFDPYFSTKNLNGTGIGLYMSKSIIENSMGGNLTVRNVPDGAEFRIEI